MNWQCKFGIHCKHPRGQRQSKQVWYQKSGCKEPLYRTVDLNVTQCCQCEQEWTYEPVYDPFP